MTKLGFIGIGRMATKLITELSKRNYGDGIYCYDNDPVARKVAGENLEQKFRDVHIFESGSDVTKICDVTLYFVPISQMSRAIMDYGKYSKKDSVSISGSSVMTAANEGFESLDKYVDAISAHCLFGPTVNPKNQTTALVRYKASDKSFDLAKEIFGEIGNYVEELPSHDEHDKIMWDVQGATHMSSMTYGVAVKEAGLTYWRDGTYKDNFQKLKTLLMLRLFGGNPVVYREIAMKNPNATNGGKQYRRSVNEWSEMLRKGNDYSIDKRINGIQDFIFEDIKEPIHLDDPRMGPFRLDKEFVEDSNFSIIVQGDLMFQMGVNPYNNPACQTGPYKLRLGMLEHLFTNKDLLKSSLNILKTGKEFRNDMAFTKASNEVSSIIEGKNGGAFHQLFDACYNYYLPAIPNGMKETDEAIEKVSSYGSLVTKLRDRLGI